MKRNEIDELADVAVWYNRLRATNNDTYMALFGDQHRYLILKGGAGSGKSIFAGRKVLERVTSEPGHRWLVCRKVARTIRESCFKQLCGQIADYYEDEVDKINRTDMVIRFKNGSEILFCGLDDVEKLKSIYNITGEWIEEATELLEADFNQLDIRLRGETPYYKQIILTFNPVSIRHWIKKRFFDEHDPRARIHESTYRDNRFLDDEAIVTLERFAITDEYYFQVYYLNQWGVTGKTVFSGKDISRRLAEIRRPAAEGFFEYADDGQRLSDIRFAESADGAIRIYKQPEEGAPYVIGGDTAGEGSDYFVGQVLDNRTGEQVAVLRGHFDEDVYARQMYCLGTYYNVALMAIESNYSTYPVLELERLHYPRQYVRESVDEFTHAVKRSYGFQTNTKTRPIILSELIKAVRDDISLVNDEATLDEMLSFVRNEETLRPEAEPGAHDDCVMALAIAHYIRPHQSYVSDKKEERAVWTDSMWEDYNNATTEEREFLRKKWGNPR